MPRSRKAIAADARELLREAGTSAIGWAVSETPWAEHAAQIRSHGGKLVAEVSDPDDAKLLVGAIKLLAELAEEP